MSLLKIKQVDGLQTALDNSGTAGNSTIDNFTDTTDYTSGTTTQLTLSKAPGSENNVVFTFDGLVQHHNTYTLSGAVTTFDTPIPTGTNDVEAVIGPTTSFMGASSAEQFVDVTDFTAGTSTDITLSSDPGSENNIIVIMNGLVQGHDTFSLSGVTLTFNAVIPLGTTKIEVHTIKSASVTGNGAWTLISTATAASSSSIDFTGLNDVYDRYLLTWRSAIPSIDNTSFFVRFGTGATPTYQTSNYDVAFRASLTNGPFADIQLTAQAQMTMTGGLNELGDTAGESMHGHLYLVNPADATDNTSIKFDCWNFSQSASRVGSSSGIGGWQTATAVTAIRLFPSSGNWTSGEFRLYGLAKA